MRAKGTMLISLAAMTGAAATSGVSTAGTTEPPPPPSSPDGSDFSIVAALNELPVGLVDEAPLVSMADLDAVTAANGVARPDATGSDDDRTDGYRNWLMTMTGRSLTDPSEEPDFAPVVVHPPVAMSAGPFTIDEIDEAVGFTLADATWFADVSYVPSAFSVYAGAFDDSTLSPALVDVGGGIVSLGEGDDFDQDLTNRTVLSEVGTPQRLAQHDGRIAVSPDTTLVEDWLDGDGSDRAGHDATMVAVATALDDAGAVSAVLATLGDLEDSLGPASEEQRAAIVAQFGDTALDDAFDDEVGIGWHAADGESVMTVVYSLDDGADPDAAAEQVRRVFEEGKSIFTGAPLAELVVLDDVTTDGSVVVATLSAGPDGMPWVPITMLTRMDLPFVTLD